MGIVFSCENVTKRYQGEAVIEGVCLELGSGGIISLVGPSGVGKTTLFNALSGVDAPDAGRVLLHANGNEGGKGGRAAEDITGVSGRVSYMMQKDLLLEYFTVLDNVILPLLIRGEKKKTAREYGACFFERFGLSGYEKKYPRQLSGGMRQRAALLRTCLQKNPVILLDEPFSALDAMTRKRMQDWFQGIALEMQFAALFITHDIEEAIVLSDRVYVMTGKPGRISDDFETPAPRPRNEDFSLSGEFIGLKKNILAAIRGLRPSAIS